MHHIVYNVVSVRYFQVSASAHTAHLYSEIQVHDYSPYRPLAALPHQQQWYAHNAPYPSTPAILLVDHQVYYGIKSDYDNSLQ